MTTYNHTKRLGYQRLFSFRNGEISVRFSLKDKINAEKLLIILGCSFLIHVELPPLSLRLEEGVVQQVWFTKIKDKNLSLIMVCIGINLLTSPISFFIGGIAEYASEVANYGAYYAGDSATAPPLVSRILYFWGGFLFIQAIPLFMLLVAFLKFIWKRKEKIDT